MAFNINEFQTNLRSGGSRPSLFQVTFGDGEFFNAQEFAFKCRSTQLPQTIVTNVEVPYFGRMVKVRGNRSFADWSCTVIQDEDFAVRSGIEAWQQYINAFEANVSAVSAANAENYKKDAKLIRYRKNGEVAASYDLIGLWPIDVSAVALDWGNNDIETFDVTFSLDWFQPVALGTTGARRASVPATPGAARRTVFRSSAVFRGAAATALGAEFPGTPPGSF